jgi:hypothetical protein
VVVRGLRAAPTWPETPGARQAEVDRLLPALAACSDSTTRTLGAPIPPSIKKFTDGVTRVRVATALSEKSRYSADQRPTGAGRREAF